MKIKFVKLIFVLMPVLLFAVCGKNVEVAGNATKEGNARGRFVDQGGVAVAGAKVRFIPVSHDPRYGPAKRAAVIDSVTTDDNGEFSIALDTGTYNVFGEAGDSLAYDDSVKVEAEPVTLPPDTLNGPGSITGRVKLQNNDDPRTVFVLIMGSYLWTMPASNRMFTLPRLAEGKYSARITSMLPDYAPVDMQLTVRSSYNDTLANEIILPFTGIPTPAGLKLTYDTLKQIVTISWNTPTEGRPVKGYNIYRKQQDSTDFDKIKSGVADTVFHDSTGIQDETYEYRVAAVDSQGMEGVMSAGEGVKILGYYNLKRSWGQFGSGAGQLNNPTAIATDSGNKIYVVDYGNNRIQVFDSTGQYIKEFGNTVFDSPYDIAISDTFVFISCSGNKKVFKYSLNGDSILQWDLPTGTSFPHIAVDSSGNVYVIPQANFGKVNIYNSSGTFLRDFPVNSDYYGYLDIVQNKMLMNFNSRDSLLVEYSLTGQLQSTIALGKGKHPVALTQSNGRIFILNSGTNISGKGWIGIEVLLYSLSFEYLGKWGGAVPFAKVSDITADFNRNIYIVDSDVSKIFQFNGN